MKYPLLSILLIFAMSCTQKKEIRSIGSIERIDPALDALIDLGATVEIIADSFEWSEGPLWLESEKMLIFSDVPKNTIYKWTEAKGKELYLTPSGYTGSSSPYSKEEGSNGLTLTNDGKLVLCQHGDRRVAVMNAPLGSPAANFTPVADNFEGKKLNSPNDAVYNGNGDLFFTDPPYGLPNEADDSTKEIPFQGVFKSSNGNVTLISDTVTRPNGIAFFPGERRLIVASSDPDKAVWYTFDLSEKDSVTRTNIFYDATDVAKTGTEKGLPDGLKVDASGNVFATGPGGVWIFSQDGKLLGKIKIPEATSNCAFSADGKSLFITADMYVVRVKLKG